MYARFSPYKGSPGLELVGVLGLLANAIANRAILIHICVLTWILHGLFDIVGKLAVSF